ncbi:MAG TPA: ABC transporter substrate-binding protein [Chloroflexota bacterium]|nr:ABC transporter substrate-binding protein [Chloroflexota bacterium]
MVEISLEAQGARPNFRYDIIQPLLQGRATIEGASLRPSGPNDLAGFFDNPKFKSGDFGLLDINMGDVVPAIDAGWDMSCLPVFIKRKPVYNYLWVRADRGINTPKDLEGKTVGTVGYSSSISVYTRGFLQQFSGVDLSKLRWLVNGPGPFAIHNPAIRIDQAAGPPKSSAQRLLDGEIDASTGDITDLTVWRALESRSNVKHLFADYQAENMKLLKQDGIYTPVHIIVIGGKLNRQQPQIARQAFDAFERSRQIAYEDAQSDATGYSLKTGMRELLRDEVAEFGEIYTHGLSNNAKVVDLFLDYCYDQGVTSRRLSREQVFAAGTLDT